MRRRLMVTTGLTRRHTIGATAPYALHRLVWVYGRIVSQNSKCRRTAAIHGQYGTVRYVRPPNAQAIPIRRANYVVYGCTAGLYKYIGDVTRQRHSPPCAARRFEFGIAIANVGFGVRGVHHCVPVRERLGKIRNSSYDVNEYDVT